MMISPELYVEEMKDKDYKELIEEKDDLVDEIRAFEHGELPAHFYFMDPSPEVRYQMNLEYLGKLCDYMTERFRDEYICGGKEWDSPKD